MKICGFKRRRQVYKLWFLISLRTTSCALVSGRGIAGKLVLSNKSRFRQHTKLSKGLGITYNVTVVDTQVAHTQHPAGDCLQAETAVKGWSVDPMEGVIF